MLSKQEAATRLGLTLVQYEHMCAVAERAFGSGAGESVALVWGVNSEWHGGGPAQRTGGFVWLENTAPGIMKEFRFSVDGEEIKRAIRGLISREGGDVEITALWHSHQRSAVPSGVDKREFPGWLTDLGAIYVVGRDVTVFYSGDISPNEKTHKQMESETIE